MKIRSLFALAILITTQAHAETTEEAIAKMAASLGEFERTDPPPSKPLILDPAYMRYNSGHYIPIKNERWVVLEKDYGHYVTMSFTPGGNINNDLVSGKIDFKYDNEYRERDKNIKNTLLFIDPAVLGFDPTKVKKEYPDWLPVSPKAANVKPNFFIQRYDDEHTLKKEGQSIALQIEHEMQDENEKPTIKIGDTAQIGIKDCKLVFSKGDKKQTLANDVCDQPNSLTWAGDIDGDEKIDLVMQAYFSASDGGGGEVCGGPNYTYLYLSTKATGDELVGKAAEYYEWIE